MINKLVIEIFVFVFLIILLVIGFNRYMSEIRQHEKTKNELKETQTHLKRSIDDMNRLMKEIDDCQVEKDLLSDYYKDIIETTQEKEKTMNEIKNAINNIKKNDCPVIVDDNNTKEINILYNSLLEKFNEISN